MSLNMNENKLSALADLRLIRSQIELMQEQDHYGHEDHQLLKQDQNRIQITIVHVLHLQIDDILFLLLKYLHHME